MYSARNSTRSDSNRSEAMYSARSTSEASPRRSKISCDTPRDVASKYLNKQTPAADKDALPRRAPRHTLLRPSPNNDAFVDAHTALASIDTNNGIPLRYEGYAKIILATHVALAAVAMCSTAEALELAEFYARQLHGTVSNCLMRRERVLFLSGTPEVIYAMAHYNPQSALTALSALQSMYEAL